MPQHARFPRARAYEAHVFETGTVPTHDNLHDFFNGLVWRAFPQAKRRLNELQATEIERAGVGATRGPLRDALTLFDENGALLEAPPALWRALAARDWPALFVSRGAGCGRRRGCACSAMRCSRSWWRRARPPRRMCC